MPEFTSAQILDGINHAIKARDFEVIPSLLRLLAVQDPHAAQAVLDTVSLGEALSR